MHKRHVNISKQKIKKTKSEKEKVSKLFTVLTILKLQRIIKETNVKYTNWIGNDMVIQNV